MFKETKTQKVKHHNYKSAIYLVKNLYSLGSVKRHEDTSCRADKYCYFTFQLFFF